MDLRVKFNLIPLTFMIVGTILSGILGYEMLQKQAREEVMRTAGLMMQTASSIRMYTVNQVKPHLELQLTRVFLPQSVPAYAATEILNQLKENYPDFSYKEATLNPTNPRDKASDWEAALVRQFAEKPELKEIVSERQTNDGRFAYIARPIRIKSEQCLICHTTPAIAPKPMVTIYGETGGYGWKLDETVGAQVVSVPMTLPIQRADQAFMRLMGWLAALFVLLSLALNFALHRSVLKPLAKMSRLADSASVGDFGVPELPDGGKDELSRLGRSFNRMRRSVQKMMQMLDA